MNETERELLFLEALRACGVDNWDGFGEAVTLYRQWLKEENDRTIGRAVHKKDGYFDLRNKCWDCSKHRKAFYEDS